MLKLALKCKLPRRTLGRDLRSRRSAVRGLLRKVFRNSIALRELLANYPKGHDTPSHRKIAAPTPQEAEPMAGIVRVRDRELIASLGSGKHGRIKETLDVSLGLPVLNRRREA